MRSLGAVYQLARADFFERTRTFQYLAIVAITLWLGSMCAPTLGAKYSIFAIDHYRGIYNSAWMGIMFALLASSMLSLFGFYLVKGSVQRDRDTRVGEIVASTSVGKFEYVLGKTLSNVAVLATIVAVLVVDAVVMQLVRGEDRSLDLVAILQPIVVFALPVIAFVSAIAVLFEVLPVLRGGVGNVVYFFGWIFALASGAVSGDLGSKRPTIDAFGLGWISNGVWQTLSHVDPNRKANDVALIDFDSHAMAIRTFVFNGMHYDAVLLLDRLALLTVVLAIVVTAALAFDRFTSTSRTRERREPKLLTGLRNAFQRVSTPIFDLFFSSSFGGLVLAELRLLLKGANVWWYAVAAGLWIWTLFAPAKVQSIALGMAWIWPILIWSQLGTRETINQTEQLVYPSLHPLRRQFAALACAGIVLGLLLGSGAIVHDLATGNLHAILGVLAGAAFIPALALACGTASGTTRLFEILYLLLWYVGPIHATPVDYTSTSNAADFATAAAVLLCAAFYARSVRLAIA